MAKSDNKGLSMAIVFASMVLSASIVFFGIQMSGGASGDDLSKQIRQGIEDYVDEMEAGYAADAGDQQYEAPAPTRVEGDFTDDDAIKGDKDAPVTIVEFSDYECPFCGRFYRDTLPQIEENYVQTGKVKLVYRDYPLSFHQAARPAAMLAECVRAQLDDEAYFKMHDYLFETVGTGTGFDYAEQSDFAVGLGANDAKLKECFDSEEFGAEIDKDLNDGRSAGITGTPGFIINGEVISGAQPYSVFEAAIEKALAE